MSGETLDVSAASPSGIPIERSIHVRAPSVGFPAVGESPPKCPRQLSRVLKGAYGLTEAPRLWFLRARGRLAGASREHGEHEVFFFTVELVVSASFERKTDSGRVTGDQSPDMYVEFEYK